MTRDKREGVIPRELALGYRVVPGDRYPADSVKSARRALEILETLTRHERSLTFADFEAILGYPRSSLHGLLRTLVAASWVHFDKDTHRYALGIRTLEAGHAYMRTVDLAERARPYMEHVRDALQEVVQLAVLDGRFNVYIAKVEGAQVLKLSSEVGRRLPAHSTGVGKVLLSGLTSDELETRIGDEPLERVTQNTIVDGAELRKELEVIRRRGYALDNQENIIGVRCVAAPIRDHTTGVLAALSVSAPTIRFGAARVRESTATLLEAAAGLSAALGFNRAAF